MKNRTYCLSC